MPRHLPTYWDDEPQHGGEVDEDLRWEQILDPDPERVPLTHCQRCGKPLEAARLTCHACGDADDEEQAAA